MDLAHSIAKRSTCRRTSAEGKPMQVGCVIVTPDWRKVISVGYNGNASGLSNRCDSDAVGACGCIHGEMNAIVNCDVPRATEKIVFCTHQPCKACAKLLINLGGVAKVYYRETYRLRDGLDVLEEVGIPAVIYRGEPHTA
jgi:dCMP deaminase